MQSFSPLTESDLSCSDEVMNQVNMMDQLNQQMNNTKGLTKKQMYACV